MADLGILWFRRDLRLSDHPALNAAAQAGPVLPVFINDDNLTKAAGANRLTFLSDTLGWLNSQMDSNLVIRTGNPLDVLRMLVSETGASTVYATDDHGPYGRRRDTEVGEGLAADGVETRYIGSNYAVAPGSIYSKSATAYKVFTPFFRAWKAHGWAEPSDTPKVDWVGGVSSEERAPAPITSANLPYPGEEAAWEIAEDFLNDRVMSYPEDRDKPAIFGTSGLSPYLKWGTIHPRQLLARLGPDPAEDVFRSELAWREFYADVLFHRPETARQSAAAKMSRMEVDSGAEAEERFQKWCSGQTGFPIVDAGMRQLLSVGWMHNRVRMIVASFLVKDLHLTWQWGARFFMQHLTDGDLASNSHGWQWVAGTGMDASPYFRVFNPVSQSRKFDPNGDYLRRWIPELANLKAAEIHEPHLAKAGLPEGYPPPMVDHMTERIEALARLSAIKHH